MGIKPGTIEGWGGVAAGVAAIIQPEEWIGGGGGTGPYGDGGSVF